MIFSTLANTGDEREEVKKDFTFSPLRSGIGAVVLIQQNNWGKMGHPPGN